MQKKPKTFLFLNLATKAWYRFLKWPCQGEGRPQTPAAHKSHKNRKARLYIIHSNYAKPQTLINLSSAHLMKKKNYQNAFKDAQDDDF